MRNTIIIGYIIAAFTLNNKTITNSIDSSVSIVIYVERFEYSNHCLNNKVVYLINIENYSNYVPTRINSDVVLTLFGHGNRETFYKI